MKAAFFATGRDLDEQSRTTDCIKFPRYVQGDGLHLLFEIEGLQTFTERGAEWNGGPELSDSDGIQTDDQTV